MKKLYIIILSLILLCGCTINDLNSKTNTSYGQEITENETPTSSKLEESLVVHFLDVGEADSIFIELPGNRTMLIDAGESKSSSNIIDYISNLGYQKLDYILGTHPHADHIGGLSAIINTFDIGLIYMPKVAATSKTYENLLTTISEKNLKIKTGTSGVEIINEDNLKAILVAPNSAKYSGLNNYSLVLKLTYGRTSYLFTGDAEKTSEFEISADIDSDVLKVAHHGSDSSTSLEFLDKVSPSIAVISVGADNKYNHPALTTIKNLEKYTSNIYRTDLNGTIKITSDGTNLNVEIEKE